MKKLLGIAVLIVLFSTSLFAGVTTGYKFGKGPLKLTKHMANTLEFFLVVEQEVLMQRNKNLDGNQD